MHLWEWHYKLNQSISLTFTSVPSHSFQFTHQRYIMKRNINPNTQGYLKTTTPTREIGLTAHFLNEVTQLSCTKRKKEKGKKSDIRLWKMIFHCGNWQLFVSRAAQKTKAGLPPEQWLKPAAVTPLMQQYPTATQDGWAVMSEHESCAGFNSCYFTQGATGKWWRL